MQCSAKLFRIKKIKMENSTSDVQDVSALHAEIDRLKARELELLQQVEKLSAQVSSKRSATTIMMESASSSKKAKTKTSAQKKKLLEKWAKAAKRLCPKEKNECMDTAIVTVKETTPMTVDDFQDIWGTWGTLTQPTKDNKPKSVVTIRRGNTDEIKNIFGEDIDVLNGYEMSIWRKRAFQKAWKSGTVGGTLEALEVVYNKSKMILELKFSIYPDNSDY